MSLPPRRRQRSRQRLRRREYGHRLCYGFKFFSLKIFDFNIFLFKFLLKPDYRSLQYIILCDRHIQLRRSRPPGKFTETDLCQCAQKEGSTSRTWNPPNTSSCPTTMCTIRQRTERTFFTNPYCATKWAMAILSDCPRR